MRSLLFTLALVGFAGPAMASTCEDSFQKRGDFLNGAAFSARVQVEGMSIEKAFSQLRPILARDGIKTLSTDLEAGVLKAQNPATPFQRALPIDVFATQEGTLLNVEMVFTIPGGVAAKSTTVKKHLCSALNQLLPKASTETPVKSEGPAIDIDANALANQVKDAADNPARLRLNFIGKAFRVSGKVLGITDNNGAYTVSFEGAQPTATDKATDKATRSTILCTMAKNQDVAVAALQTNQRATLVGRFQAFDSQSNAIKLSDCTGQ